jgi:hypothetical protein
MEYASTTQPRILLVGTERLAVVILERGKLMGEATHLENNVTKVYAKPKNILLLHARFASSTDHMYY